MRAFLGQLDRLTWTVVGIGLLVGLAWLMALPVGIGLTGLAAPFGAMLLAIRRRWLEIGLLLAAIGIVPLLAYRWFGPPVVEPPFSSDVTPIELIAPGAAYFFLVVGLVTTLVAATFELRTSRRSGVQVVRHAERRRRRPEGDPS